MANGTTILTQDGYVASTNPTRVYGVTVKSGGTAAVVALKNANTTEYLQIDGTISKCVTVTFEGGRLFPGGCYVDVDTNTTYVTVDFQIAQ